jgi:type III restriction enzyme
LRPDFIFFGTNRDGSVVVDLVDPHGHHLADALPKLRGLADYADVRG